MPCFPLPLHPIKGCTLDDYPNHYEQVQRWLGFFRQLLLRDDHWLDPLEISFQVWEHLVENPVFPSDRETGFKWFGKVCVHFKMKADLLLSLMQLHALVFW